MPEERVVDPDESQGEATPDEDPGQETGDLNEGADEGVEEEEEQAAEEELDDRGLPWKNKVAEMQRKLDEADVRATTLTELLKEKSNTKETITTQDMIESVTDAEFKAVGIDKATADLLRKSQARESQREIAKRIREADEEAADNLKQRKEVEDIRIKSLHEVQKEYGDGEFGGLIAKDSDGKWQWDHTSELWKRTAEIFNKSSALQNRPDGQATSCRKAILELTREKYGKAPPKKDSKLNKSQKMLGGKGGGGGGRKRAVMDADGNFDHILSEAEFDKLSAVDQPRYLTASVLNKDTWK